MAELYLIDIMRDHLNFIKVNMTLSSMQHNVDLTQYNTMGFTAHAANYLAIEADDDLAAFFQNNDTPQARIDCFVLGGGSNLVLTRDVTGVVLHMRQRGIRIVDESSSHVRVAVAAGEVWHHWVMHCVEQGWLGLENLALIPGSVGACPVQNIGAYGVEVKDTIDYVKAWDRAQHVWVHLSNAECGFAYRDSVFKREWLTVGGQPQSRYIITEVVFKLLKDASQWRPKMAYGDVAAMATSLAGSETIQAKHVAQAIISIRQSKLPDPAVLGNAGSFFKNPIVSVQQLEKLKVSFPTIPNYPQADASVKIAAGWLVEQAGYKGMRDGAVGVYEKQALVLVHHGGGHGCDLMALAQRISDGVFAKFEVRISPEPIVY